MVEDFIKTYQKKPVKVTAILNVGSTDCFNALISKEFSGTATCKVCPQISGRVKIETLEGVMTADIGDYIIKGVSGELYPCKPDIFKKTYDEV